MSIKKNVHLKFNCFACSSKISLSVFGSWKRFSFSTSFVVKTSYSSSVLLMSEHWGAYSHLWAIFQHFSFYLTCSNPNLSDTKFYVSYSIAFSIGLVITLNQEHLIIIAWRIYTGMAIFMHSGIFIVILCSSDRSISFTPQLSRKPPCILQLTILSIELWQGIQ